MKAVVISDLDNFGRGIAHIDGKVVFVKNALPGEIVDIKITESKKRFSEGEVIKYQNVSPKRIKPMCPYFNKCGGCQFLCLNYEYTLKFKKEKVENLIKKSKLDYDKEIEIIKNKSPFNYRNKISLKIVDGKIGYYENESHKLVEINACFLANLALNEAIATFPLWHINNGVVTIRTNQNKEILLIINSDDECLIEPKLLLQQIKLIGIVYNDKLIYGNDFYYERIANKLFKVSYNSFFQVNPYITEELFKLITKNIPNDATVLDLYSGVGSLSIVAASKASVVYSVEVIENAVLNGILNARLNECKNIKFMLGDASKVVANLKMPFTNLIIDPPRSGLDNMVISFIKERKPKNIIYISCDVNTLMRDLHYLSELYSIKEFKILDMFSYTYHVECFCVLGLRYNN